MQFLSYLSMHIGKEIQKLMRQQGRTTVWLARQLGCARTFIYRIYERPSIDTSLLLRISKILEHDFFCDYSVALRETKVSPIADMSQNEDTL